MMTHDDEIYLEQNLTVNVNRYVTEVMDAVGHKLTHTVRESLDLQKMRKVAFAPRGISADVVENPWASAGISGAKATDWLIGKIQDFLKRDPNHVVVLEDACSKPSDEFLRKSQVRPVCFGDDVYFALGTAEADMRDRIGEFICAAESWALLGYMSSLPATYLPLEDSLNSHVLTLLAKNTCQIIVTAFDSEGYILCVTDESME